MKINQKHLQIGCVVCLAVCICAVGGLFFATKRMGIMMGSPAVFVAKPAAQGAAHEAWFLNSGLTERDWNLFVRKDATQRPRYIKDIMPMLESDFAGIEWSRDGALLVLSMSETESRVYAYDFSTDKVMTPPTFDQAMQSFLISYAPSSLERLPEKEKAQKKQEVLDNFAAWDRELDALISAHGGPEGPMITERQMKNQSHKQTYREYMELRKAAGWH